MARSGAVGVFKFQKVDVGEAPSLYPTTAGIEQDGVRETVFGKGEPLYRFVRDDGTIRPRY